MKYGDVALGVECALPAITLPAAQRSRVRRLTDWLRALIARRY